MAMCLPQLLAAPARLERMLASSVDREERFRPRPPSSANDGTTSSRVGRKNYPLTSNNVRTNSVRWLQHANYSLFRLCPSNFSLALNIFDRFLTTVKVQPKHVQCAAAASFLLAAKITQEPESEPSATEIVDLGECNFTATDLTRMERIILEKLSWDIDATTPLTILQQMHALVCSWGIFAESGVSPLLHLRSAIQHLESCLLDETFVILKPSALALAVLAIELRQVASDWLAIMIDLQTLSKVSGGDLSVCYEAVLTRMFDLHRQPTSVQSKVFNVGTPLIEKNQHVITKTSSAVRCLFPAGNDCSSMTTSHKSPPIDCTTSRSPCNVDEKKLLSPPVQPEVYDVPKPPAKDCNAENRQLSVSSQVEDTAAVLNPRAMPFIMPKFTGQTNHPVLLPKQVASAGQTSHPLKKITTNPSLKRESTLPSSGVALLANIKLSSSRCGSILISQSGLCFSPVKVA